MFCYVQSLSTDEIVIFKGLIIEANFTGANLSHMLKEFGWNKTMWKNIFTHSNQHSTTGKTSK